MVAMLNDIANGGGDLTLRLRSDRRDESGAIAGWLNTLLATLQTLIHEVVQSVQSAGIARVYVSDTPTAAMRRHKTLIEKSRISTTFLIILYAAPKSEYRRSLVYDCLGR